ncbi:DNA-binding protein [Streptomyces sp. NPDC058770]|uniref:DNA-binding protein n=1 Tax=Streptomyces sp. NPDC058770 TaxID=3346631 RepID=UPI0036CD9675
MIPRNRPVINEADIAARAGVPVATWRRRDAPAFRQHVPNLLSGGRLVLYNLAQAEAYLAGKPVPALKTEPHPKDRLNATEAADILGIESSTVHAYAVQGYLSRGETVYGTRVWPRHEIEQRRDNPPSRGDTPVISRIAASLAQQHGGSARTWERLLTQARQTTTEP